MAPAIRLTWDGPDPPSWLLAALDERGATVRRRGRAARVMVVDRPIRCPPDGDTVAVWAATTELAARAASRVPCPVRTVPPGPTPEPAPSGRRGGDGVHLFVPAPVDWAVGIEDVLVALAALTRRHPAVRLRVRARGTDLLRLRYTSTDVGVADRIDLVDEPHGDVAVLPALEDRAWPGVVRALAGGTPVVASVRPGLADLIDESTGCGVPTRDPSSLAAALDRLLGDDELRTRTGQVGRRRAERRRAVAGAALDAALAELWRARR